MRGREGELGGLGGFSVLGGGNGGHPMSGVGMAVGWGLPGGRSAARGWGVLWGSPNIRCSVGGCGALGRSSAPPGRPAGILPPPRGGVRTPRGAFGVLCGAASAREGGFGGVGVAHRAAMALTAPPPHPHPTPAGRWCRALLRDYAEALRETLRWARRRPMAAGAALASAGGAAAAVGTVPDRRSFDAALLDAASALLLLPPNTRSAAAERHVQRLQRRRDRGQLRYRHLALLAVLYEEPHDAAVALYGARCPHVRPRRARLWDVGFAGRWWALEALRRDCDVNDEEFAALPAPLRRVRPGELRSDGTERLRERRARPAVLLPRGDDDEAD